MSDPTSQELLRAAQEALMRGDIAERDRLCALAKQAMDRERKVASERGAEPLPLEQGPDGVYRVPVDRQRK